MQKPDAGNIGLLVAIAVVIGGAAGYAGGKANVGPPGPKGGKGDPGNDGKDATVPAPLGSIIAWHRNYDPDKPDAVLLEKLPDGWIECNGQRLTGDKYAQYKDSRFWGMKLPDLNGEGRFLRGNVESGKLESDSIKFHNHLTPDGFGNFVIQSNGPHTIVSGDGGNSITGKNTTGRNPDGETETRPINMSVVWIIRVK